MCVSLGLYEILWLTKIACFLYAWKSFVEQKDESFFCKNRCTNPFEYQPILTTLYHTNYHINVTIALINTIS